MLQKMYISWILCFPRIVLGTFSLMLEPKKNYKAHRKRGDQNNNNIKNVSLFFVGITIVNIILNKEHGAMFFLILNNKRSLILEVILRKSTGPLLFLLTILFFQF